MIVFCPNCGTQNSGLPGAKSTCVACTSVFEVPFDAQPREAPAPPKPNPSEPAPAPPPPTFSAPGAQVFASPPLVAPKSTGRGRRTNTSAVLSLVFGIICCIPLLSPVLAIVFGMRANRQIDASPQTEGGRGVATAGIILGVTSAVLQALTLIGTVSKNW